MARANLSIDDELSASFISAQKIDSSVRFFKVQIQGEAIVRQESVDKVGTSAEDFATLKNYVQTTTACMILYNTSEGDVGTVFNTGSLSIGASNKEWCLICWIPDTCAVREKMLYSSSREDIKKALGPSHFKREYSVSEVKELSWAAYIGDNSTDKSIYESEKERILKQEDLDSHAESKVLKSNTMALLPFDLTSELLDATAQLQSNDEKVSVLEMYVHEEVVGLTSESAATPESKGIGATDAALGVESFSGFINADHGRFYVIKVPPSDDVKVHTGTFFVYSCPESTAVRMRMTMSSCKATVLAKLQQEAGLTFTKTFEIREPEDINEYMFAATKVEAVVVTHSKPTARGRQGTRKVKKFVADD